MNDIAKLEYPCMPLNIDYEYYKGDSPNEVCSKCEYRENLYDFIQKQYNQFALLKCCEKNPKSEPHPEAIFVDKNNNENTLTIEVKSINKLYNANERKNDLIAGQHHSFDKRHLDEIGYVLLCALNNVLTSENHTKQMNILYYSFLCEHTRVHFGYDTKNKCTFKDIFLKVEKKEIRKIYEQLFNCFKEFYKSIIGVLVDKIGETNMSWDLVWEIKEIQYEFDVTVYFTDVPSAITWSDFNPYAEWRPNKEILSQRIFCFFQECERKFSDFPNSRHILLLKNESRYFTGDVLRILNQLKKPDYIDEVWLSEYEYEEIYDDEGELLGEKKIDIHYRKIE